MRSLSPRSVRPLYSLHRAKFDGLTPVPDGIAVSAAGA
jgi:hypothetical protein